MILASLTLPLISIALLPISFALAQTEKGNESPQQVQITWVVTVPEDTPRDAKLFIAGSLPDLGPWQPNKFELQRQEDGTFRASLDVPGGTSLEYKITRGSWGTVEKSAEGGEIRNRVLVARESQEVKILVRSWAIPRAKQRSSAAGDLRWRNFSSRFLQGDRRITVWLPPQYRSDSNMRFQVAYLLDGQNVFDSQRAAFGVEWQADEAASELATSSDPTSVILVAIDNSSNRMSEYTFAQDTIAGKLVGGEGDKYLSFITDELKPWIDQEFRTLADPNSTALIGSSLGGLFVLNALKQRPDIFGKGIAMSPSLFWGNNHAIKLFSEADPQDAPHHPQVAQRLWLDMGTKEGDKQSTQVRAVEQTRELTVLIEKKFPKRFTLKTMIEPDAQHNESAWARRLPLALDFIFSVSPINPSK